MSETGEQRPYRATVKIGFALRGTVKGFTVGTPEFDEAMTAAEQADKGEDET